MNGYIYVHEMLGTPWWATVVIISLFIRGITFPVSLIRLQNEQYVKTFGISIIL